MTDKEHRIIVMMLSIHFGMVGELINTLTANGTLQPNDLQRMAEVSQSESAKKEAFDSAWAMYKQVAAHFGVNIG
jgi:hypothetical protein